MTEPALDANGGGTNATPGAAAHGHWPREFDADYQCLGELGRGGMAVVFHARDRVLGRDVAIKVVRPRFPADDEAVDRLIHEARTVARLEHPNIVGVYTVRPCADHSVALVMQLVPGRTLRATLEQEGPLDPARAEHVLRDVARALAFAHKAGIVHRDVKPENIFIDEISGRALLSDFGVARVMDAQSELTATGTTIGTPSYMAPEQIDSTHVDGRTDLYSLGLVGWEMLSGQRPWAGESLYNVIYRQKHDPLPPIEIYRDDVPLRLQYLLEGMMQKSPERRWSGATRLLALLATDQVLPGFREWQATLKRRRKSGSWQRLPDTKPDSGNVFETVRFDRRTTPTESAAGGGETESAPFLRADDEAPFALADNALPDSPIARALTSPGSHEAVVFEPPRRRYGLWVAAAAVFVGVAVTGALVVRQRARTSLVHTESAATLRDQSSIPVPVVIPPAAPPNDSVIDSLAAAALARDTAPAGPPTPSPNGAGSTTPSKPADQLAKTPRPLTGPSPGVTTPAGRDSVGRPLATALLPNATTTGATTTRATTSPAAPPAVAPPAEPSAIPMPVDRGTITAGGRHSCVLENGRALCWGNNDGGQLGDGAFDGRSRPTPVAGDFAFTQIAAGAWHTCALTASNEIYCWGKNDSGQLGDGTTSERTAPVRVNSSAGFRSVRSGDAHTCALTRSGTVYCWGANAYGQLGDGSRTSRASPVPVTLPAPAAALVVGSNHTCALTTQGAAWCWGQNSGGQLGDGTTTDRTSPVAVSTDEKFMSIAAGSTHSCAVTTSGVAQCWGQNAWGQLGLGFTGVAATTPRSVESTTTFTTIVAGKLHTCARSRDARAWCWGRNVYGQLGDGTTTDRSRPVPVTGITSIVSLHASGAHTCGMTAGGEAYCWGYNIDGQLGDGDRENVPTPTRVLVPR